jgi:hypothetical protein
MRLSICYMAGELIVKQTGTTSLDHVNGDACSASKKQPWFLVHLINLAQRSREDYIVKEAQAPFIPSSFRIQKIHFCTKSLIDVGNSYLCTYDLYGPVRNAFDADSIHYESKWEGVGPRKSRLFWALPIEVRCTLKLRYLYLYYPIPPYFDKRNSIRYTQGE